MAPPTEETRDPAAAIALRRHCPAFAPQPARHKTCDLDGLEIHLIHRNNLVLNKLSTGREKDLADVLSLQFIEAYWNGQKLEVYEKPTPQLRPPSNPDERADSAAE